MTNQMTEPRDVVMLYDPTVMQPHYLARLKNIEIAARFATLLGGSVLSVEDETNEAFGIPFHAVESSLADELHLTNPGDIYGAVVDNPHHANKSMLHDLIGPDAQRPSWYSAAIARAAHFAILPGFTTFSLKDTETAVSLLQDKFGENIRIKDASRCGGAGQTVVTSKAEAHTVVEGITELSEGGVVVEPELFDPELYAVSTILFNRNTYSWVGTPWYVMHKEFERFGGNRIVCVRGNLNELANTMSHRPTTARAVGQAAVVNEAYPLIDATVSRATYDVISGRTTNGRHLSGVIDPSLRPSASSPAEICAIEAFNSNIQAKQVVARVEYHYDVQDQKSIEMQPDFFVGAGRAAITASAAVL